MPDLEPIAAPPRSQLLRLVRGRLGDVVPSSRLLAEDVLAADTPIDFVVVDSSGRVCVVLLAEEDRDLELVGRAVAQRAWLEARLPDWLKLAPELGVRPELGVGAVLLGRSFCDETRAAARALGDAVLRLVRIHALRNGSGTQILVERPGAAPAAQSPEQSGAREVPPPSPFRTGLTDAELGLTADERSEFE